MLLFLAVCFNLDTGSSYALSVFLVGVISLLLSTLQFLAPLKINLSVSLVSAEQKSFKERGFVKAFYSMLFHNALSSREELFSCCDLTVGYWQCLSTSIVLDRACRKTGTLALQCTCKTTCRKVHKTSQK